MGYYTRHSLEVKEPDRYEDIEAEIMHTVGYCPFEETNKWYEHEKDCITVSKMFPTVTFAVTGEGEEQGDVWRKKFFGGKLIETLKPEPFKFPPL